MRSIAAGDAKNRFGELLDAAQREPVTIEKHGRAVAVIVSAEDYRALETLKLAALRGEIASGLADAATGKIVEGKSAFKRIRSKVR